jgi:hypothetical protein
VANKATRSAHIANPSDTFSTSDQMLIHADGLPGSGTRQPARPPIRSVADLDDPPAWLELAEPAGGGGADLPHRCDSARVSHRERHLADGGQPLLSSVAS